MLNAIIFLLGISGGIIGFVAGVFLAVVFDMHGKIPVLASGSIFAVAFALGATKLAREFHAKLPPRFHIPFLITAIVLAYYALLGLIKLTSH